MKKYVLTLVFATCAFFGYQEKSEAFSQPQPTPFTWNGHTYNHAAALKVSENVTFIWYCSSNYIDAAYNPTNGSFGYFCGGANADYSNLYNMHPAEGLVWICYNASCSINKTYYKSYSFIGGFNAVSLPLSANLYSDINVINTVTREIAMNANLEATETPLRFPLNDYTAYTAPVSSAMDQSTLGNGATYAAGEDNIVETFEGEIGDIGPYSGSTCYRNFDNTAFGVSFNYVGTGNTGGSHYLCYDAHPGYDYPATLGTYIHAPTDGTLCVATTQTAQQNPSDVWRNTSKCPLPSEVNTRWLNSGGYNTFYIIHEGVYVNGSINNYMTVFLHSDDLESSVRADIEQNGYAQVTEGEHIAQVGNVNTTGAHMHFEVYKKNGSAWDRIDPYGDGTDNILWEQN